MVTQENLWPSKLSISTKSALTMKRKQGRCGKMCSNQSGKRKPNDWPMTYLQNCKRGKARHRNLNRKRAIKCTGNKASLSEAFLFCSLLLENVRQFCTIANDH